MIAAVSNWVLDAACFQLAEWRSKGFTELRMGINLSPREFERNDLFERIATPLNHHCLPPEAIEIEIT